ncbi:MAG TPA: sigma-70 family RNA polymerase sigma factor [bacterium]|nr:sigma-70 family RNA polymerase sigma factor [bacterium]
MQEDVDEKIRRITEGRLQNFRQLYEEYRNLVRRAMFRLTPRPLLDDLVQEAFLKIWRGLPRFEGRCELKIWIYRIVRNVAVDGLRRQPPPSQAWEEEQGTDQEPEAPRLAQNEIRRLLAGFDMDQRDVIVLFYMEELSIQEISEVLNLPIGTVKSRLHRAREKLRQLMEDIEESHGSP